MLAKRKKEKQRQGASVIITLLLGASFSWAQANSQTPFLGGEAVTSFLARV